MKIQKIHYKIEISKKRERKTYYSKYLSIQKIREILEDEGWEIISIMPIGRVKI